MSIHSVVYQVRGLIGVFSDYVRTHQTVLLNQLINDTVLKRLLTLSSHYRNIILCRVFTAKHSYYNHY